MLYLLDKDAKTVKWNGIPLHEARSAIVKEETNGDFYLTVHYPITDSGIYQLIKEDMLIKAPVPVLGAQLFRIKKPIENDDSLDITAYHVSDDIMKRSINPLSVVGQGCAMALSQMVQNVKTGLGDFSFTSDIMDSRTFNTTETETLYSVLLDGKHSIVGTWEGELVRDNFALTIKRNRGADRGVVITTHKNLKSYQRTKNSQSVVTRIHAKSTFKAEGAETDTVLTVTVDSPLIGNYPYINEKDYENNNAKTTEELRKWAEAKFTNEGIDKVSDAIEIEAYELDGQVIHLGDTVNIKSRKHDVDIYKKAVAYEYNALTEEYISITFDDKPGVGGSGVSSGVSNAAEVILNANRNAQEVAVKRAIRNANQAFDAEFDKRVEVINDGIEQAKAEAELYADNIKQSIDADVNAINTSMQAQSEEHDRQVADILSQTQSIEELANQAKTDAAGALSKALQYKNEAIADARAQVATVSQALNTAKTDLQNQVNAIDAKAVKVQSDSNALRTDLNQQAQTILAQAQAQTALTNRVTTVETLADGTRSTVAELSKTVSDATGDIASVASRTKTVEDTLSQTRTQYEALTQTVNAQTGQIDSINRKTADLQSGIDGVTERFENLQVGGENLLLNAGFEGATDSTATFTVGGVTYIAKRIPNWFDLYNGGIANPTTSYHAIYRESFEGKGPVIEFNESDGSRNWKALTAILQTSDLNFGNYTFSADIYTTKVGTKIWFGFYYFNKNGVQNFHSGQTTINISTINKWHRVAGQIKLNEDIDLSKGAILYIYAYNFTSNSILYLTKPKLENGTVATAFSLAQETIRSEIAEYKRTVDQNYAGLQSTVSTLDGKVSTAETKINQLTNEVSSKVSQTDYNTLTGRVSSAETAITQNATEISKRLTSTQVEQAITDKGYATVTVLNNKVKETSDSFSLTISETRALIPTYVGGRNLIPNTKSLDGYEYKKSDKYMNFNIARTTKGATGYSDTFKTTTIDIAEGDTYTVSFFARTSVASSIMCYWYSPNTTSRAISSTGQVSSGIDGVVSVTTSTEWKRYWVTWTQSTTTAVKSLIVGRNHVSSEGTIVEIAGVKLEKGTVATDWSPAPEDLATVTALHAVNDTVDSHTRTIGAVGTSGSILDNVSKVTQTANGLVTEVSGDNGLKTQVSTLAGSYAIKSLTKAGDVLGQINLNKDGSIKLDGSLVQITGTTYIQDSVISSAKIADLDAGKITTGTLNAARIAVNSIDGSKLVFDQAFVNKMTANEALFKQLFAQNAFITQVQAVTLSASQITSGILRATNGAMVIDLDNALTEYKERATIRFHSAGNVLYREKTHPRGHNTIGALMFKDSNGGGVMTALGNTSHQTIDTMRNNYGEGGLTGSFAGIRIVRDDADTQRDRVDIIADRIIMAHSTNLQEPTNSGFYFYPTAVRGWWNLGAILQNISNKFEEHGWGKIGDIYHLGYAGETSPSQYT